MIGVQAPSRRKSLFIIAEAEISPAGFDQSSMQFAAGFGQVHVIRADQMQVVVDTAVVNLQLQLRNQERMLIRSCPVAEMALMVSAAELFPIPVILKDEHRLKGQITPLITKGNVVIGG